MLFQKPIPPFLLCKSILPSVPLLLPHPPTYFVHSAHWFSMYLFISPQHVRCIMWPLCCICYHKNSQLREGMKFAKHTAKEFQAKKYRWGTIPLNSILRTWSYQVYCRHSCLTAITKVILSTPAPEMSLQHWWRGLHQLLLGLSAGQTQARSTKAVSCPAKGKKAFYWRREGRIGQRERGTQRELAWEGDGNGGRCGCWILYSWAAEINSDLLDSMPSK